MSQMSHVCIKSVYDGEMGKFHCVEESWEFFDETSD